MTQRELYFALLRPCVIHILRAAGFHAARPAALDALVDMAARYLELLAVKTAEFAYLNHNGTLPTTTDVRMALQHVGLLKPELNGADEQIYGDDDLRGVESLITWFQGPTAHEIRRIAGLEKNDGSTAATATAGGLSVNVDPDNKAEDFLTTLKKKHSKTGDEARFQGTMLGRDLDSKPRFIEGGPFGSIRAWEAHMQGEPIIEDENELAGGSEDGEG